MYEINLPIRELNNCKGEGISRVLRNVIFDDKIFSNKVSLFSNGSVFLDIYFHRTDSSRKERKKVKIPVLSLNSESVDF